MERRSQFYSGVVWILAAMSLFLYGAMGYAGYQVPGVEDLVRWLSQVDGMWILVAAFVSIFIEGLYFVGSFFPGSTLVVLIAVLSQLHSWSMFGLTIFTIFFGWIISGAVNISVAHWYHGFINHTPNPNFVVKDRVWTTWFPAFRANYEVAQVISGAKPQEVFWSSLRVKVWASIGATIHVATLPFFIDVTTMKNEEGFLSLFLIAVIMIVVGVVSLKKYYSEP